MNFVYYRCRISKGLRRRSVIKYWMMEQLKSQSVCALSARSNTSRRTTLAMAWSQ